MIKRGRFLTFHGIFIYAGVFLTGLIIIYSNNYYLISPVYLSKQEAYSCLLI